MINLLVYMGCNNCDIVNEKTGYSWNGIYLTIITGLTNAEIDLLQTEPLLPSTLGMTLKTTPMHIG